MQHATQAVIPHRQTCSVYRLAGLSPCPGPGPAPRVGTASVLYLFAQNVALTFRALLGVSLLLNLEQTLWCLLVAPMIPEVTPSGEKRMLVFPFHSHSISPEASVRACRLETCGLSRIGRNCLQNTGTRARLGISSSLPLHQHTRMHWSGRQAQLKDQRRARSQEWHLRA